MNAKVYKLPKKKECPSCAFEVGENETHCTICNYEFPQKKNYDWRVVTAIILIVVLSYFLTGSF
ncbi:hypothetical protein IT568_13635 [bacterium]|nr:hypothetical protein [bacterium]